jgi:hypothetical protein
MPRRRRLVGPAGGLGPGSDLAANVMLTIGRIGPDPPSPKFAGDHDGPDDPSLESQPGQSPLKFGRNDGPGWPPVNGNILFQ